MYRRILVPTDFSSHAEAGFAHAQKLAASIDAELILLHVFVRPPPPKLPAASKALDQYLREAAEEADARVQEWVAKAEGKCRGISVEGVAWREVLATVEREDCDLICMSSHGRGALADMLVGSVTERVMRRTPVPILVVRPGGAGWKPEKQAE